MCWPKALLALQRTLLPYPTYERAHEWTGCIIIIITGLRVCSSNPYSSDPYFFQTVSMGPIKRIEMGQ